LRSNQDGIHYQDINGKMRTTSISSSSLNSHDIKDRGYERYYVADHGEIFISRSSDNISFIDV
jgi:hypothetical protein